jgi:hypothetical protein
VSTRCSAACLLALSLGFTQDLGGPMVALLGQYAETAQRQLGTVRRQLPMSGPTTRSLKPPAARTATLARVIPTDPKLHGWDGGIRPFRAEQGRLALQFGNEHGVQADLKSGLAPVPFLRRVI